MQDIAGTVREATSFLATRGVDKIDGGIVLGTGLGQFPGKVDVLLTIPYHEIPHFAESTVETHKGNFIIGRVGDKTIAVLQGRYHYYEGYNMQQITFPVRVLKALGAKFLLLSNAAGGMNKKYKKGNLILIDDHINKLPDNPLRGLNDASLGNRFVDMAAPYDEVLNEKIRKAAKKLKIKIRKGIYVSVEGPSLETRAEYRYLRGIGADMVGMSTVPEVIVANHIGLPCAAVSVITDECDPDNLHPVNIEEIIAVAGRADDKLSSLMLEAIKSF